MTNPTHQDVAALVARLLRVRGPTTGEWPGPTALDREAATALSTLAAERSENAKEALAAQGQADESYQRLVASEARATALEAERDAYKRACEQAGVCMTCVVQAPDTFGCTDCLNTGLEGGGQPPIAWMNADHVAAYRSGSKEGIAWASQREDDFYTVPLFTAPAMPACFGSPAPVDGRGDQMGAAASCPHDLDERGVNALTAVRPIIAALIQAQYNVETWGLRQRLSAIDDALSSPPVGSGRNLADATPKPDLPSEVRAEWRDMADAPRDGKNCILSIKEGAFFYSVQGAFQNGQWNVVHRNDVEPVAWMPNVLLPDRFVSALTAPDHDDVASQGGER